MSTSPPTPARFTDPPEILRIRAGLTQQEAADRAGIPVRTVGRVERERGANVELRTITKLAAAYGVSPGTLADSILSHRKGRRK